jgi:DNA-binding transcriptional ArsR family regulator
VRGDADIAALGSVLADERRCRILLALGDGRALPASVLADEAGVAPSTASEHLKRLRSAGLVRLERHGRHRYFRLAGPQVGELLEVLSRLSRAAPVRSLRQGTRAEALRAARTCYDHLAGRLGVALMEALLDQGVLEGGDGLFRPDRTARDRLAAAGNDVDYRLTEAGVRRLEEFGIDLDALPQRRPLVRYCVDWSEQRHHLGGTVGRALAHRLLELRWLRRADSGRAVHVTPLGRTELPRLGVSLPA